jgi:hypothetical protein
MNEGMEMIAPGGAATLFRKNLFRSLVILTILLGPGRVWATPGLPDLVVDGIEVLTVPPGQQTVDGQSYPEVRTYVVFTIRNKGTDVSPSTRVEIYCHSSMANDPCPSFPSTDIPMLWPKPSEISGSYKIWNSPAAVIREDSMMGFRVTVDPDNLIPESNNENNVGLYSLEQYRNRVRLKRVVHADQLRRILQIPTASLESGNESKKMDGMPAGNPAMSPLVIQGLSISPTKTLAGVPFELLAEGLNEGRDPIQSGHSLSLSCRVIRGGPNCPVPTGSMALKTAIPAKGLHRLNLGAFSAQPGVYEITLSSGSGIGRNVRTLTLAVEAGPVTPKAPAVVTPKSPPAAGQAQTPSVSPAKDRSLKRK